MNFALCVSKGDKSTRMGAFLFGVTALRVESPCLCRYDRQKLPKWEFLGRSAAVACNLECIIDREAQNEFCALREQRRQKHPKRVLFFLVADFTESRKGGRIA